ncbi:MAG: IS66 family insertion sequence element accessory protein TnpB [Bacteroidales bacterium]|nr:IS66 family insertion sequence element accessory protein TnpB [Bacteroidales bacterium]
MLNRSKITVLLEQRKESGLSVKSFCSNEGIAKSTFYYWQKKLRKEAAGGRFIPLLVRAPGSGVHPAPSQQPAPGMANTPLEITYPNGTTLRIRQTLDLAGLRSLVSLLD